MSVSALCRDQFNRLTVEAGENLSAEPPAVEGDDPVGKVSVGFQHDEACLDGWAIYPNGRTGGKLSNGFGDISCRPPIPTARHPDELA